MMQANDIMIHNRAKTGLIVRTLEELIKVAHLLVVSGCIPKWHIELNGDKAYTSVLACMLKGMEIGLPLMTSVQYISRINGNMTIWGDAALALVKQSISYEYIYESYDSEKQMASCKVKRKDEPEAIIRYFSWEDAVNAKLDKKDTYQLYKTRLLQLRARAYALRDVWPDVLLGIYMTEEFFEQPGVTIDPLNNLLLENRENNVTLLQDLNTEKPKEEVIYGNK